MRKWCLYSICSAKYTEKKRQKKKKKEKRERTYNKKKASGTVCNRIRSVAKKQDKRERMGNRGNRRERKEEKEKRIRVRKKGGRGEERATICQK